MNREFVTVIKQSTHRWIKQTGVFAVLSAAMVYAPLSQAQFPERTLHPEQWQAMGAQTAAVEVVPQLPSRPYSALALMPWNQLQTFSSPVSGQLIRLHKVHGEVREGEAIAVIESAQLAAMQSELLAVQAELTLAKQSLNRTQQLQNTGVASSKQLQQAQAEVNRLAAVKVQKSVALKSVGFTAAQLDLLLKSQKVEQTELVIAAPMDGALFEMSVRQNERVAQDQKLFAIGPLNPIMLDVQVPIAELPALAEGMAVAIDGHSVLGQIDHIEPLANPLTQTVEVHILVEGVPVLPGQRLSVRFLQKAEAQRTLYRIPARALAQWEGQAVLFQQLSADAQAVRLHALPIEVAQIEADWLYFYAPSSPLLAEASIVTDATTAIKLAFLANEPAPAGEE